MFTKTTATIILTIFCLPQTGFAGPALNRSEATGLGPAQNLRAEAAAQGKVGAEVGDAVIATAQSVATPQHIKTKLKGGVYKIDFRLPTGQTITMRMNVQSLEADNDRILEIESIIGGVVHKAAFDLFSDPDTSAQAAVNGISAFFTGIKDEQKENEPLDMNVAGAEDRLQAAIKALILAVDAARQAAAGQPAAAARGVHEAEAAGAVVVEINTMATELVGKLPAEKTVTVEQGSAVVITNSFAFTGKFLAFLPALASDMLKDVSRFAVIVPEEERPFAPAQKKMIEYFNALMPEGKRIEMFSSERDAFESMKDLNVELYGYHGEQLYISGFEIKEILVELLGAIKGTDYGKFEEISKKFKALQKEVAAEV